MPEFNDEQNKVIKNPNGKMIVSASAGSGKTTVMIERILHVLENEKKIVNGNEVEESVENMLVLTFTNASAHDMKLKLEKKLLEKVQSSSDKYAKALTNLPFADICTIDSFCSKVVRSFFEHCEKLDPCFEILDETDKNAVFTRALKKLKTYLTSEDAENNSAKKYCGSDYMQIVDFLSGEENFDNVIKSIYNFLGTITADDEWLNETATKYYNYDDDNPAFYYLTKSAKETARYYLDKIDTDFEGVKTLPFFAQVIAILDYIVKTDEYSKITRYCGDPEWERYNGKNTAKVCADESAAKKLLEDSRKFIKEIGSYAKLYDLQLTDAKERAEYLIFAVKAFIKIIDEIKRKENKYDFADIEKFAYEILQKEDVKERLSQKYDYIFVDEYQDTNELQEKIIDSVTKENKFMVGDVKQSIYGFRDADPQIFVNTTKCESVEKINFDANYRSSAKIIDVVNGVFSQTMKADSGVDYKGNPMNAQRGLPDDDMPAVTFNLFEAPQKAKAKPITTVYSVRDNVIKEEENENKEETLLILDAICELLDGKHLVYKRNKETGKDELQTVSPSDIAILCRTTTGVYNSLISGLKDRKISFSAESKEDVLPQIQVLMNFLRIVNNGMQDIPLSVTMLRLFGFNEQELICGGNGDFNARVYSSDDKKIKEFAERLAYYRFRATYCTVYEILREVTEETDYLNRTRREFGEGAYLSTVSFIEGLLDKSYALNVSAFINYYDTYSPKQQKTKVETPDSVSVMTVHGSKGLEFPIVFLADVAKMPMPFKDSYVMNKDLGIGVQSLNGEKMQRLVNLIFLGIKEARFSKERDELNRLLYVAMTRAQNHLFITGTRNSKSSSTTTLTKANTFLNFIEYATSCDDTLITKMPPLVLPFAKPEEENRNNENETTSKNGDDTDNKNVNNANAQAKNDDLLKNIEGVFGFTYPHSVSTKISVKYAVTSLAKRQTEDGDLASTLYDEKKSFDAPKENATYEEAAEIGTLYHKVLEELSFNLETEREIDEEVEKLVEKGVIPSDKRDKISAKTLKAVIDLPVIKQNKDYEIKREYPFMLSVHANKYDIADTDDFVLIQGIVDLLVIKEGKATVVDYKFSSLPIDVLAEKYKKQLALYKEAVEKSLGIEVEKCVIVSVKTAKSKEIDL